MEIDVAKMAGLVRRELRHTEKNGKPAMVIVASRVYDTDVDDLWEALTTPARIQRWFLPITGELKRGGRFQFVGNAGGEIQACEPPRHVAVTWEMNGDVSWVDVVLAAEGAGARLTLEHTAHPSPFWDQFGPGAVGIGWELGLLGMHLHLAAGGADATKEGAAWAASEPGKDLQRKISAGWCDADVAAGRDVDAARRAAAATLKAYFGEA